MPKQIASPETELDKRFWLRLEMQPLGSSTGNGKVNNISAASLKFRVTKRLSLLTNHKPGAELLSGTEWKLQEKRNA